jgi:hypothetical protein
MMSHWLIGATIDKSKTPYDIYGALRTGRPGP